MILSASEIRNPSSSAPLSNASHDRRRKPNCSANLVRNLCFESICGGPLGMPHVSVLVSRPLCLGLALRIPMRFCFSAQIDHAPLPQPPNLLGLLRQCS